MSGASCVVLTLLLLAAAVASGTHVASQPPAEDPGAEPLPPAPRAAIHDGLIVRDDATERAIQGTVRSGPLPRGPYYHLRLVVSKSRYRLDVIDGKHRIKVYPIALGGTPAGEKLRQGDRWTPEGEYLLVPHHRSPSFGPCFYVCYPSPADADRGRAAGLLGQRDWRRIVDAFSRRQRPPADTGLGGLILIHGTRDRSVQELTRSNWTDGCIAMENDHLRELLAAYSPADRPLVRIRP